MGCTRDVTVGATKVAEAEQAADTETRRLGSACTKPKRMQLPLPGSAGDAARSGEL